MIDTLGKLFGSTACVKLLRLFLFNAEESFTRSELQTRTRITSAALTQELGILKGMKLIKSKSVQREGARGKKKRMSGYILNPAFPYRDSLRKFMLETVISDRDKVGQVVKSVGRVQLVVLSGIFTGSLESPVDIFIVGDRISQNKVASAIGKIEAMVGREIRYAALLSPEFKYRREVNDRVVRDVFDYTHTVIIDKLGIR